MRTVCSGLFWHLVDGSADALGTQWGRNGLDTARGARWVGYGKADSLVHGPGQSLPEDSCPRASKAVRCRPRRSLVPHGDQDQEASVLDSCERDRGALPEKFLPRHKWHFSSKDVPHASLKRWGLDPSDRQGHRDAGRGCGEPTPASW